MFKSIVIIVFMFIPVLASDLKLSMDVETGWIPHAASSEYRAPDEIEYKATNNVFMLSLHPELEWKFLYGSIDLTALSAAPKEGISFFPFRMVYGNEFGVFHQFSSFKAFFGWEHNCQHKVITTVYPGDPAQFNDFGYDKIFLRVSFSNR